VLSTPPENKIPNLSVALLFTASVSFSATSLFALSGLVSRASKLFSIEEGEGKEIRI